MIITKIQRLRGKKSRYSIYLDGSQALELSDGTIGKFGLRQGNDIDDATLTKLTEAETEIQAKNVAINYLSYRQRSSREILEHLAKKGFNKNIGEKIIRDLQSIGMINDIEFARLFVRDRLKRKPAGRALLRQQLLAKGISRQVSDQVLGELVSPQYQHDAALELAKRKLRLAHRSLFKLDEEKRKKRLIDFLLRRGFSYEITLKTIRSTLGN
jgi:regulatory protein